MVTLTPPLSSGKCLGQRENLSFSFSYSQSLAVSECLKLLKEEFEKGAGRFSSIYLCCCLLSPWQRGALLKNSLAPQTQLELAAVGGLTGRSQEGGQVGPRKEGR